MGMSLSIMHLIYPHLNVPLLYGDDSDEIAGNKAFQKCPYILGDVPIA